MVFSSLFFVFFFLALNLIAYHFADGIKRKNMVLLGFSLVFYAWGGPKYLLLLLSMVFASWIFALLIDQYRESGRSKLFLICDCVFMLGLLCIFKYLTFFSSITNTIFHFPKEIPQIALPIGISFYTFQLLSYVIDVYRREVPPQHDPFSLALYVSMFPQLIAGPIVRYHDVNVQLAVRKHSFAQFSEGISRFLFGLSKKVLLSNVFAQIADGVFKYAPSELSAAGAWMGAIGYTLQIYFDFSGYSDMAIGLGKMFGFEFLENFNYPYISKSVTEFWRRWHISLSTWFRDYVYIPLGGNRCSPARHIFNLLAVWTLTGFWHGANWTFMAWGLYFGVLLILEKKFLAGWITRLPSVLQHVYALFFIVIGWVFFRSDSMGLAVQYLGSMFTSAVPLNRFVIEYLLRFWPYLLFGVVLSAPVFPRLKSTRIWRVLEFPVLAVLFTLCLMRLLASSYNPFIYFRF